MVKFAQSKYVINIIKEIIYAHSMKHLSHEHILVVRVALIDSSKSCEIFRMPQSLISAFGFYYLLEVYPNFDIKEEHDQHREIFHCLKHIPEGYKEKNSILPHDYESFYGEHLFVPTDKTGKKKSNIILEGEQRVGQLNKSNTSRTQ